MHPFVFAIGVATGAIFGHIITQHLFPAIGAAIKSLVVKELQKIAGQVVAPAGKTPVAPPAPPKA